MAKVKNKSFLVSLPVDAVKTLDDMASEVNCSRNFLVKTAVMSLLADYAFHAMESALKEKSRSLKFDDLSD